MKKILRLFFLYILSTIFIIPSYAVDVANGKLLHDENCLRCHNESKYVREKRMVNNFKQLHERVVRCEIMAELMWFDEEIEDVTAYLNNEFYKFDMGK